MNAIASACISWSLVALAATTMTGACQNGTTKQSATLKTDVAGTIGSAVLHVPGVSVPKAGATVTIYVRAANMSKNKAVATLYILGSHLLAGNTTRSFTVTLDIPKKLLDSLGHGRHASATAVACSRPTRCVITGPVPLVVNVAP